MKHSRSNVKNPPEPVTESDETMAMVYVGDVYSLVAQEGTVAKTGSKPESKPTGKKVEKESEAQEEPHDALWPFIR